MLLFVRLFVRFTELELLLLLLNIMLVLLFKKLTVMFVTWSLSSELVLNGARTPFSTFLHLASSDAVVEQLLLFITSSVIHTISQLNQPLGVHAFARGLISTNVDSIPILSGSWPLVRQLDFPEQF